MKDLTKVIDTLDSIKKVMECMKEHTHDGITITTTNTDYFIDYGDVTLCVEVENKMHPECVNSTFIFFSFWLDYSEVKEIIMLNYNRMCEEMRAYMEEDERLKND